ncbi:MAG TPA: hypothetical protein PKD20_00195 [Candidatus Saccharibacteria bacterium]|nr:hypothetical protein [Candidatus Saccharibacteria bacterium]HMT55276.1 hypothetical protein [Candidatus Saccharibacteria bacterium]
MDDNNQQNTNTVNERPSQFNLPAQLLTSAQPPQVSIRRKKWYLQPLSILAYIIIIFSVFIFAISQDIAAFSVMGMGLFLLAIGRNREIYKQRVAQNQIVLIENRKLVKPLILGFAFALLLTGGIIWFVLDQKKQEELSAKITSDVTSPYNYEESPESIALIQAETTRYNTHILSNWGLSGELPEEIQSAKLYTSPSSPNTIVIRSKSLTQTLADIGCGTYCEVGQEANVISILREMAPTDAYGNPLLEPFPESIKKIGNYYYRIADVHGSPPSSPTSTELQAIAKINEYYNYGVNFFNSLKEDNKDYGYLEIKEWSVKFKISRSLDRYSYEIIDRAGNQIVVITNSEQVAVSEDCGVIVIERSNERSFFNPATDSLQAYTHDDKYIKQLGNYTYMKQPEQAACYSTEPNLYNNDGTFKDNIENNYEILLYDAGYATDGTLSNLVSAEQ